jgi:maltose alpha-D-glucosyltransferase/alpha-amylase
MVEEEYPVRPIIAESNMWPEDLLPYFGDGDECHMCFHFPIMPRLYQAIKAGDKTPIVEITERTPQIPEGTAWLTFLRNHDELTLEMVTPEVRQWMWEQYAPEPRMRLNMGIRRRLAPLLEHDKRRWLLIHGLFLTMPGTPIVYYGDEIGMGDNIWLPDRHGCRTPMQWSAVKNAGFSDADETYFPVHDDYTSVNVAAQEDDPDSYLNWTRFLIQTRQAQPALRRGDFAFVPTMNKAVLAYTRSTDEQEILCMFNLTDEPQPAGLHWEGERVDLLARDGGEKTANDPLQPFAAHWLVINP